MKLWLMIALLALSPIAWADTSSTHLYWGAVTQNTDGTPAVLAGYRIYRGASATQLTAIATVDATALNYLDAHPPAGLNFYAIAAFNSKVEGAKSPTVNKRIRLPAPKGGVVLPQPKGGVVLPTPH